MKHLFLILSIFLLISPIKAQTIVSPTKTPVIYGEKAYLAGTPFPMSATGTYLWLQEVVDHIENLKDHRVSGTVKIFKKIDNSTYLVGVDIGNTFRNFWLINASLLNAKHGQNVVIYATVGDTKTYTIADGSTNTAIILKLNP